MEVDIELTVTVDSYGTATLVNGLSRNYLAKVVGSGSTPGTVEYSIRFANDVSREVESTVGVVILDFVQGLTPLLNVISRANGILRLGIYYDLRETMVFPLILSAECVKSIASFELSLDCTGYPCSE
jgi:hypothetical protein